MDEIIINGNTPPQGEQVYYQRFARAPWNRDHYQSVTDREGVPFLIRFDDVNSDIPTVIFNENWNAGFLIKRYKTEFDPATKRFLIPRRDSGNLTWSKRQMRMILSFDLADYWRQYHPKVAEYLLPRRSFEMLKHSVELLRGRLEEPRENI